MKKSELIKDIEKEILQVEALLDSEKQNTAIPGNPYINGLVNRFFTLRDKLQKIKSIDSLD